MKHFFCSLYHYIGSVSFTIPLIGALAGFVIAGTFLESSTDSHEFASHLTYSNPLFFLLLIAAFANILISALRRWPFRYKHIPFLITHLGLLMVLGGVMVKKAWGTQGSLLLLEGAQTDQLLLRNTMAVVLEPRDPQKDPIQFPLHLSRFSAPILEKDPQCSLIPTLQHYTPHGEPVQELWFEGGRVFTSSLPPQQVVHWEKGPIPETGHSPWGKIYAVHSSSNEKALRQLLGQSYTLNLYDASSMQEQSFMPLDAALDHHVASLSISSQDLEHMELSLDLGPSLLPLSGSQAGWNVPTRQKYEGSPVCLAALEGDEFLAFLKDETRQEWIVRGDRRGKIQTSLFDPQHLSSLFVLDDGFQGYGLSARFSSTCSPSLQKRHAEILELLCEEIEGSMENFDSPSSLSSLFPNEDFSPSQVLPLFLREWYFSPGFLYPPERTLHSQLIPAFQKWDWDSLPNSVKKALFWGSLLLDEAMGQMGEASLLQSLQAMQWPLSEFLQEGDVEEIAQQLLQQVFSLSDQLPPPQASSPQTPSEKAHYFSIYLLAHGICSSSYLPLDRAELLERRLEEDEGQIELEVPLRFRYHPQVPPTKWENRTPLIQFSLKDGEVEQTIALAYDPSSRGLKTPLLHGRYLARLQPQLHKLPYQVRLRDVRQINYAQSNQAFSYECDLLIGNEEVTLSMNQVHETWEGYRFYMASLTPSQEISAQRAQIVVSRDPAKYLLTYPGAFVLSLGIFLLFWTKPYSNK